MSAEIKVQTKVERKNPTFRQVSVLEAILGNLPFASIPKHLRRPMYELKAQVEIASKEMGQERTIIFLMNGGEEKENQGNKYIALPDTPTRKTSPGSDKEFEEKVKSHFAAKTIIENEMSEMLKKKSKIQVSAILTEQEFEELGSAVGFLDWQILEELLVKNADKG